MKSFSLFAVAVLAVIVAAGCPSDSNTGGSGHGGGSGDDGNGGETSNLSGDIAIAGSSTVQPIANVAAQHFNKKHPGVRIEVAGEGSGSGFAALKVKECDIADASRPVKGKEFKACQEASVSFIELPIAYDGLTICVHKENDFVNELTVEQLHKIFCGADAAKTWKEVNDAWPDENIAVFAPGDASGTYDYFLEVMGKHEKGSTLREENIQKNESDAVLVTGVSGDKNGIGFFGYAHYDGAKEKLKAVPIINPKSNEAVTPSFETIESGEYAPFSRPLFMYVDSERAKVPQVKEFIEHLYENSAEIVAESKYVPLPEALYEQGIENFSNGVTGTHYLDAEGNKRSGALADIYKAENLTE